MLQKLLLNTQMVWTILNIEEYNPNKRRKILIVFDDMIGDMFSNKKLNPIVTEFFLRGRKHFSCFYHKILFRCSKKYQNKFNTLFLYKNCKQKKASTNRI